MSRTESYTMRSGARCGMTAHSSSAPRTRSCETDEFGGVSIGRAIPHVTYDTQNSRDHINKTTEKHNADATPNTPVCRTGDAHHRASPNLGSCTAAAGGASATPTTTTGRLFSGTATAIGKGTAFSISI